MYFVCNGIKTFILGIDLTVNCGAGYDCFLTCAGNGCFGSWLVCDGMSSCDAICDESVNVTCPTIISSTQTPSFDDSLTDGIIGEIYDAEATMTAYKKLCDGDSPGVGNDVVQCDDYSICSNETFSDSKDPICCRGEGSCNAASFEMNDTTFALVACDGYGGCHKAWTEFIADDDHNVLHCGGYGRFVEK